MAYWLGPLAAYGLSKLTYNHCWIIYRKSVNYCITYLSYHRRRGVLSHKDQMQTREAPEKQVIIEFDSMSFIY